MSGNFLDSRSLSAGQGSAVLGAFAFSCGVILLYRLTVLPPPVWLFTCLLPLLLWFLPIGRRLPVPLRVFITGLAFGLAWAVLWAHERLDQHLPDSLEGEQTSISGYVCNLPVAGSFNSTRFSFCVTRWHNRSSTATARSSLPDRLRLAWYDHPDGTLPGHRLRLDVVLKRPHGSLNPEGFRYEDWLFRKGYRATGSVRNVATDSSVLCSVKCRYYRLYAGLAEWVHQHFSDARHYPLIASLLIGNRGKLTSTHWDVFKATGTIHLVAISGLHLGLVALGAGFVARRVLLVVSAHRFSERSVRRVVFVAVVLCCLLYALAAGFTVPTRRALVMVVVGGWFVLMGRQVAVWQSLVIALGLVLLLDPFAPLDQGFWLSFGAVAALICVFAGRLQGMTWLSGLIVAQVAAFAGLWPLLELAGLGQPVAGLFANILAIPWVSLIVMPVLIAGGLLVALVPACSDLVIPVIDASLQTLWWFLERVAGISWPDLEGATAEIAGFAGLVLLVATVPVRLFRVAGSVLALIWMTAAMLPGAADNPSVALPEVRVWDVGQGLSALLRAGDKVIIYDTGPEVEGVFSAVESVLVPNLRALGIRRIDTLVISHADSDHSGGLHLLAEEFDIRRILTGEPAIIRDKLGQSTKIPVHGCAGAGTLADALSFSLWQSPGPVEGNDASCVLTARHGNSGVEWIFPGDISAGIESRYLAAMHNTPVVNTPGERIVVAPHHGSKTSSSQAWVSALMPDRVIYTAGYLHRYGHPHRDVTARYRKAGAAGFNTACSGALVMTVADNTLKIQEARHKSPFWISASGQARDQCQIP